MEIDVYLINILFKILQESQFENPKEILEKMSFDNGVVTLKLDTEIKSKEIIKKIEDALAANYDSYKFNVILNDKKYKLRFPTLWRRIFTSEFVTRMSHPFYYGILISLCPFLVCAISLKFFNISLESLNSITESASDNFVNVCFIFSTLIITYLITKAIAIRQEKTSRINSIRNLGNQLTEFRRICKNVLMDPSLFTNREFYQYAYNIKKQITFAELEEWTYSDDESLRIKVKKYIYDSGFSEVMLKLFLQLDSFYLENGFNPTSINEKQYPADYVYSLKELENWQLFIENNLIWYVFEYERHDYVNQFHFVNQAYGKPIISSAKRFDRTKYSDATYNSATLLEISLDVQNIVLPNLLLLTKKNEEGIPFVFKYFISCFAIMIFFGVIVKTLCDLYFPSSLVDMLSILITIAVLIHMLISLRFILSDEVFMDRKNDYR